jgi:hypothetical protein
MYYTIDGRVNLYLLMYINQSKNKGRGAGLDWTVTG